MKVLKWQSTGDVGISSATLASIACGLKRISMVITSALPMTQQTFGDALHLLSRFQKSEIHSTRLQSAFRHSKESSTNGIHSLLCWSLKWRRTGTKHQRLTEESASYARINPPHTRWGIFIYQDIQTYHRRINAVFIAWFAGSIPYSEIALMQHELQPDSLVDLKFIMADTGFGKTFIYDRIKSGDLPKAKVIHGRARWLYRDHCEFKNKLLSRANG